MLKVPEYIISNIMDEAMAVLKDTYDRHMYEVSRIPFEDYLKEVLNQILDVVAHEVEVSDDTIHLVRKKRQQAKRRWMDKELDGKDEKADGYYREIEIVARGVYDQFKHVPGKFQSLYECDCKTFEEFRESVISDMRAWMLNDDAPVCHFRYVAGRKGYQLERAMNNDIEYLALKTIREKCPLGMQSAIVAIPNSISNIPIDFTNRIRIDENSIVQRDEGEFFLNTYDIDDETLLESLLNVDVLKTGVLNTVVRQLNGKDIEIFRHLMSIRDENFYSTREIVVDIGDVVRHVFESDGIKNYMTVKESLYRMAHLTVSARVPKSLRGFTVRIFDNVEINKANGGEKEIAKITVNIDIVNEYVKNQTITFYREIIDEFRMDSSKIVIFPLQRERIRCATTAKEGEPLLFHTNINFFRGILYFSNKRKLENIKTVEKTLNEIIRNRITVKWYERKGDTFTIEFYPISDQERRDLLDYNNSKGLAQMTLDII